MSTHDSTAHRSLRNQDAYQNVVQFPTDGRLSLTEQFIRYHEANPGVYGQLRKIARDYLARTGAPVIGVQMLMEVFRYEVQMQTRSAEFKINNNFGAFYARALDHFELDLRGKFHMRRSDEADTWIAQYKREHGRAAA